MENVMHLPPVLVKNEIGTNGNFVPEIDDPTVKFLSLELTNRCNLKCVHCYTESHPGSGDQDVLTADDYLSVMKQAYALGCRVIQFIGGEAQLSRDFLPLLIKAHELGFQYIEVFTNLTRLSEDTLRFAAKNGVRFATSVYSDEPEVHDAVTTVRSSHARTIANLKRLIGNGVETRAAIIRFEQTSAAVERTQRFLQDLGVRNVRVSQVREFGRGESIVGGQARMSALCGHCWDGKLCVGPDGSVYPCVMARQWPVGNILEKPLAEIVGGTQLRDTRGEIFEKAWKPKIDQKIGPTSCVPCSQSCDPSVTSCQPNEEMCVPFTCPQSCMPLAVQRGSQVSGATDAMAK
jgi:radical SAM protein with 4Fe4S-binding SPASM domain